MLLCFFASLICADSEDSKQKSIKFNNRDFQTLFKDFFSFGLLKSFFLAKIKLSHFLNIITQFLVISSLNNPRGSEYIFLSSIFFF